MDDLAKDQTGVIIPILLPSAGAGYPRAVGQFGKRDDLVVHRAEPFNAETAALSLSEPETSTDAFYVRNHGAVGSLV